MTKTKLIAAGATLAIVLAGAIPTIASAHTMRWRHHHPRQAEVLRREHHQMARINEQRREGELSGPQARALRHNERTVARQEHFDARDHGGHITRGEQRQLNREENAQSAAIGH